ncbi:MAG TPA: hypothetical protein VKQ73_13990 [Stellaceae bacterium]|nr:hypothetical protein [Stellaceae bacterium]
MSMLETQLRRCRRECTDRRRYLAQLSLLGERLRLDARQLLAEVPDGEGGGEGGGAGGEGAATSPPLIERHRKLAGSVAEIESQIAAAGRALAVAEQELRAHELASAQRAGNFGSAGRLHRRRMHPPGRRA